MADDKVETFRRRIGLSTLTGVEATDGVKVDWNRLPEALATEVKGLRADGQKIRLVEPGLGEAHWSWRHREQQVFVSVFVSGQGSREARERLVHLATETTMVDSPLVLGPAGLGDLSVQYMTGRYEDIIWVFRNICVEIENADTGLAILPIARRMQAFMQAHVVKEIARYVPRIEGIDVSQNPVSVGEDLRVKVRLPPGIRSEDLMTTIREVTGPHLEPVSRDGLTATFTAREPGRTEVQVIIVDPKTLLSPKAGVFIDVLPAH